MSIDKNSGEKCQSTKSQGRNVDRQYVIGKLSIEADVLIRERPLRPLFNKKSGPGDRSYKGHWELGNNAKLGGCAAQDWRVRGVKKRGAPFHCGARGKPCAAHAPKYEIF
jgi:hypothetical protein